MESYQNFRAMLLELAMKYENDRFNNHFEVWKQENYQTRPSPPSAEDVLETALKFHDFTRCLKTDTQ